MASSLASLPHGHDISIAHAYACCGAGRCGSTQDDWDGWVAFNSKVGTKIQTVGDDLTVTNIKRIKTAADRGACNALLLKVRHRLSPSVFFCGTCIAPCMGLEESSSIIARRHEIGGDVLSINPFSESLGW